MTAKLRSLPTSEAKAHLDMLAGYGIDLAACAIDIGPDGIKVSPPANINAGGDSLDQYIDGPSRSPKAGKKR